MLTHLRATGFKSLADFEIDFHNLGVAGNHKGVEEFMKEDGVTRLETLLKHVALDHLLDGEVAGKLDNFGKGELVEPVGVEFHLSGVVTFEAEDFSSLVFVGLCVLDHLFFGELGSSGGFVGGITNAAGKVTD